MLKVGDKIAYNSGIPDEYVDFDSVDEELEICIKAEPVTKIVVTEIKFNR